LGEAFTKGSIKTEDLSNSFEEKMSLPLQDKQDLAVPSDSSCSKQSLSLA